MRCKKMIRFFSFGIFSVILFSGCGKSYTCECKVTLGSIVSTQSSTTTDPTSKKKAQKICEDKTNLNIIPKTECYLKE